MSEKLPADQITLADRAIIRRLIEEPAKARELVRAARAAIGPRESRGEDPCYRHVDRWLQRNRKKALVSVLRIGRYSFWSLTQSGREALAA